MTPEVQAALIALAGTMFASFMAYMTLKLRTIGKVADKTHTLVNSSFSAQLKISAIALRRIADITKHPDDDNAASVAERLHREHEQKQSVVDQGGTVIPGAPSTSA